MNDKLPPCDHDDCLPTGCKRVNDSLKSQLLAAQTIASAIARYAEHRESCSLHKDNQRHPFICDCGLSKLIKQTQNQNETS